MKLPQVGDVVGGKYVVETLVGEGGFGVVYKALTQGTGRTVALKMLKPRATGYDPTHVARFLRELKAIAQLQSPHTMTVFDYGRTEDGILFMVCEYIEGADLRDVLIDRGKLAPEEVAHVLQQALLALAEAHDQGILHRDIKPDNLRVFQYGNDPLRVKVLDFGLAKSFQRDETRLTATGRAIGTPRYMAPEQLAGLDLGPAADIYSLGLVGYELATGKPARGVDRAITEIQLTPESGVGAGLCSIINRMAATQVSQRYAKCSEVLADLRSWQRFGDDGPATAVRGGGGAGPGHAAPVPVVRPRRSQNDTGLMLAGALGLLLAVLAAGLHLSRALTETSSARAASGVRGVALVKSSEPAAPAATTVQATEIEGPHSRGCGEEVELRGAGFIKRRLANPLESALPVFIPTTYESSQPHPLVVLVRGPVPFESLKSPRGVHTVEPSPVFAVAEREKFIVLRERPSTDWPPAEQTQDEQRTSTDIDDLLDTVCIDPTRLYLIGESGDSLLAELIACRRGDIRALATVRGGDVHNGVCKTSLFTPRIELSNSDLRSFGFSNTGRSANPDIKELWRTQYGCSGRHVEWWKGTALACDLWECETPFAVCEAVNLTMALTRDQAEAAWKWFQLADEHKFGAPGQSSGTP